jgi:hypothetical protein
MDSQDASTCKIMFDIMEISCIDSSCTMVESSGNAILDMSGGISDLISMFQPIPDQDQEQYNIDEEKNAIFKDISNIPCVLPPPTSYARGASHPIPSCKSNTFMTVYSTSEQQLYYNYPVIFENNDIIEGDCSYDPLTGKMWIWRPGYYYVYSSIYHLEACQFGLIKNGAIVKSSVVGSLTGSSQNTNTFLLEIGEQDMIAPFSKNTPFQNRACLLRLINYSPKNYVTLIGSNSSGNIIPQISASMTFMRIR